jgi:putative Ca2+/H+ antiporter (TMEM165/GDT1 family)
MDGFLLAFVLVAVCALGGRDQVMVGQWADALGARAQLLVTGCLTAAIAAAAMAWIGADLAHILPRRAGQMLVAFALLAAAVELAWPVRLEPPREPTRSLGAFALVLLARQVGDAARFAVFALAAWSAQGVTAGLGGALGGAAAVGVGWTLGAEGLARRPLRVVRGMLAAAALSAALFIAIDARFAPL